MNWGRGPLTLDELTFLLPMLDDPELAWARGVGPSDWWEYLMRMVSYAPPAITPDTTDWRMTPDAYRELSNWRHRAREPRLRDFATLAWFSLDPGPRYVELATRVGAGGSTDIAAQALRFANGGVPPRDAPAEAWRQWVPRGQVGSGHGRALSLYALIHPDRDVRAEIVRRATEAEDAEERAFFRTLGGGLGLMAYPSPDQLVSAIASGDSTVAARAKATLGPAFGSAEQASDSLGQAVIDDLLGQLLDGGSPWRRIREPDRSPRRLATSEDGVAFLDSVPSAVPQSWAARIPVLSREEWSRRRDADDGTWVLRIESVRQLGPIVEVRYSTSHPAVYYHRTVYLVRVDGEFHVLSEQTILAHSRRHFNPLAMHRSGRPFARAREV